VNEALFIEKSMREHLKARHAALIERIESTKDLPKEDEAALLEALKAFKQGR